MAHLKVSVLKDGAGMELTARCAGEPNDGAVFAAMAVTAFVPRDDAPGDVVDGVTLMPPSQRPMIFQDSELGMRNRVGVLETAVDNAVDHRPWLPAGMCQDAARYRFSHASCHFPSGVIGRPSCTRGAYGGAASARCKGGAGEPPPEKIAYHGMRQSRATTSARW